MDFEHATLKKTTVNTLPLWEQAERDEESGPLGHGDESSENGQHPQDLSGSPAGPFHNHTGSNQSNSAKQNGKTPYHSSTTGTKGPLSAGHTYYTSTLNRSRVSSTVIGQPPEWSVFATMSNVSTLSGLPRKNLNASTTSGQQSTRMAPPTSSISAPSAARRLPQRLDDIFKQRPSPNSVADVVPNTGHQGNMNRSTGGFTQHGAVAAPNPGSQRGPTSSKRGDRKEPSDQMRGYPTGQCVSTTPPKRTNWDEDNDMMPNPGQGLAKNTAFNLEALKMFLNSPLFSNFLKSITIVAAASLFAIALDSIVLLAKTPDQDTQFSNDNAACVVTVILSVVTIAYSCFTIFLESRRPPEGLDTSNSKPLFVIFTEIIASIVWAQILSVSIYIYIWTYGCTAAGKRELERLWKLQIADQELSGMLCRRQGAMVGLELLLVVLLIFNFYTHLATNFRFIRAVS
ncbi:hypothetical protein BGW38_004230 [Lunasporangiospora selenospora]|uniref:Uncharacterized protein n=1 Tax=Lunasporangiospora selenospora TaxID=979761 RepID=A0A9P6KHF2_9FUNG|nr:hypothetical protein BGW38_004230 [Lunasporangiospora selenospora]